MNDEPIWSQEFPTVSAEMFDAGPHLVLTLTTGRGPGVSIELEPGDAVDLMDALNDWVGSR